MHKRTIKQILRASLRIWKEVLRASLRRLKVKLTAAKRKHICTKEQLNKFYVRLCAN